MLHSGPGFVRRVAVALAITVLTTGTAAASDRTEVMAKVHQWMDGLNRGDKEMSLAACADQTSIIDDVPPHEWHGPEACSVWMTDLAKWAKENEVSDAHVTLGKARHISVTGDHAYVVIPASLSLKLKGKPIKSPGPVAVFALQKAAAGWRITGWAWVN